MGYFSDLKLIYGDSELTISKCTLFEVRIWNNRNNAHTLMLISNEQAKELADFIYERLNGEAGYDTIVGTKKG